jgi:hypothetical protein
MTRSDGEGGVEPPQSKVLRTSVFMSPAVSDPAATDLGKFTGCISKNVETPGLALLGARVVSLIRFSFCKIQ